MMTGNRRLCGHAGIMQDSGFLYGRADLPVSGAQPMQEPDRQAGASVPSGLTKGPAAAPFGHAQYHRQPIASLLLPHLHRRAEQVLAGDGIQISQHNSSLSSNPPLQLLQSAWQQNGAGQELQQLQPLQQQEHHLQQSSARETDRHACSRFGTVLTCV